ncbi:hypothetical protein ACIGMX_39650 [Streptomyces aquilus]|uniref:hypothetical protein n=1 Tax=Streptomyces aquilus TaxID=2548456 RepID=UPI0037D13F84
MVATGARLLPEEAEGLTGPGWGEKVFPFYDLPGAVGLRDALERFEGGRLTACARLSADWIAAVAALPTAGAAPSQR